MQLFSEFIKQQNLLKAKKEVDEKAKSFNESYAQKLREYGVSSPLELTESQKDEFFNYLKTLNSATTTLTEAEVTDEKSFTEYATVVLKKAHPDNFDEKIANKVISDLIKKKKDDEDWGAVMGRLSSGLGG